MEQLYKRAWKYWRYHEWIKQKYETTFKSSIFNFALLWSTYFIGIAISKNVVDFLVRIHSILVTHAVTLFRLNNLNV